MFLNYGLVVLHDPEVDWLDAVVTGDECRVVVTADDWPVVEPAVVVAYAPYGNALYLVGVVLEELEELLHAIVPVMEWLLWEVAFVWVE